MTALPINVARLIPFGTHLVLEDLDLATVRLLLDAAALEIGTLSKRDTVARQLLATSLPANWREHVDMVAAVTWLGGEAELEALRAEVKG